MATAHHPVPAHPLPVPRFPPPAPGPGPAASGTSGAPLGPVAGARRPADELGRELALPVGAALTALAVTALLATGRAAAHPAFSLAVFALLTVAVAAAARPLMVPAVVAVSWLFYDGFVVHRHAELGWQPADRTSLWVLAGAGLAAAGCAVAFRAARTARDRRAGAD
ncbi:hypothetical protein [Streptomyces sp. BHT-5-2]|uniref:hypothetical protein n=1 Tax=Streptomyces sp. BHT-5-2 TaxID=2866715 RepID=UPI0021B0F444|nr:hypothetical protein [Streptomyces sp. BHT-5-2]